MGYITPADFVTATTGAYTKDLGPGGLQSYIDDASAWVDLYCERTFVLQAGIVETMLSGGQGPAVIDRTGTLQLYPARGYPITAVTSLTWQVRNQALYTGSSASASQSVGVSDMLIDKDRWNEGWRVLAFVAFGAYRDPGTIVQLVLTYDAGYAANAYPHWLSRATILATMGMLRRRDGPQVVVTETAVRDLSNSGGEFKQAMSLLESRRRKW